jgi:hypothetical protein
MDNRELVRRATKPRKFAGVQTVERIPASDELDAYAELVRELDHRLEATASEKDQLHRSLEYTKKLIDLSSSADSESILRLSLSRV